MPRGGARTGTPGTPYGNRSDLRQPITTTSAAQYGDRQQAIERQQAVPLPRNAGEALAGQGGQPAPTPPPGTPGPSPGGAPGGIPPGLGLHDPTARPNEPVTAGLSTGPGDGPSPLIHRDPDTDALRTIYAMHPSNDLLTLIQKFG